MLVDAERVPGLHLDAGSIEIGAKALRRDATAVRDAGAAISGAWQGLGACYETPDTDQVLRTLDPVRVAADKLADDLDAVADALVRFADDVRSLQSRRSGLVVQIGDFRSRVTAEADVLGLGLSSPVLAVQLTGELPFENTRLIGQSRLLGEEFEIAERECARKIKAIGSPATLLDKAGTWFQDTAAVIGTAVTTGWGWTTEAVEDGAGWMWERDMAVIGSWADVGEAFGLFPVALAGTADDPRPQLTRVAAAYLQTFGANLDAWGTTLTTGIWDVDLAGDGEPVVGTPIKTDGGLRGQQPERDLTTISDILWSITDSYKVNTALGKVAENDWTEGYVRVTTVSPLDGSEPRMVVSIPGTQPWWPWDDPGNDHPADFIGDLVGAAGGRSTYSDTVAMAIDEVMAADPDLDAKTPILLAGHSLGGITAADLASDPEFLAKHNVTDVITAGSPIDNNRINAKVHVLEIDHKGDIVPELDFADTRVTVETGPSPLPFHIATSESDYAPDSSRYTKITLPNPESDVEDRNIFETLKDNHGHFEYGESVAKDSISTDSRTSEYKDRLMGEGEGVKYLDSDAEFEAYDVPVGRK